MRNQWIKYYPTWVQPPGSKTTPWPLFKCMIKAFPKMFFLYFLLTLSITGIGFLNVKILQMAIESMETNREEEGFEKVKNAAFLVFTLIFSQVLSAVLQQQNEFIISLLNERIKHGVNGLIFEKVGMKSIQRDPIYTMGEITNLTQVDTEKISMISSLIKEIFMSPVQTVLGVIWLFWLIGPPFAISFAFLIIMVYFNKSLSKNFIKYRSKVFALKDRRGKLLTEVFTNIRFIKMNGLENFF